jgi:protein-L-isoaspartate(D-aspartate) O-methyltransferase
VLSHLVEHVYSIEIVHALAARTKEMLSERGFDNITVIQGDGYNGLPDEAPFDGVIVTAAPGKIPQPLIDQLDVGARLVIPVGTYHQELKVLTRTSEGIESQTILPVRFVPMTGEAEKKKN